MNLIDLLFSFQGRINRAKFWLAVLICCIFGVAVVGTAITLTSSVTALNNVALLTAIPIVVSAIAVGVKRLHDRNKDSWWLIVFYGGSLLSTVANGFFPDADSLPTGIALLQYLSFAVFIWALVELGCLRGTISGNRYGGDPLAPQPASPRTIVR